MAALNEDFWPSKYDDHAGALDKLRSGVHGSMKPSLRRLPSDGRACLRPSFLIREVLLSGGIGSIGSTQSTALLLLIR